MLARRIMEGRVGFLHVASPPSGRGERGANRGHRDKPGIAPQPQGAYASCMAASASWLREAPMNHSTPPSEIAGASKWRFR